MGSQFPEINSLCHKSFNDIYTGPDLKDVFFLFVWGCQCVFTQRWNLSGFVLIQNKYKKTQFFYSCDKNEVTYYIGDIAQVDAEIKSWLVI